MFTPESTEKYQNRKNLSREAAKIKAAACGMLDGLAEFAKVSNTLDDAALVIDTVDYAPKRAGILELAEKKLSEIIVNDQQGNPIAAKDITLSDLFSEISTRCTK